MLSSDEISYVEEEITQWLQSKSLRDQKRAIEYYNGIHDIRHKTRCIKGENGELVNMETLPNNRLVNNLYALSVDQKGNYEFARPPTITTDMPEYRNRLKEVFDERFMRTLKTLGKDTINCGIGWLYPFVDGGELKFKKLPATEILPFWKDNEHNELNFAVRYYTVKDPKLKNGEIDKVEIFTKDRVEYYTWNGHLVPEDVPADSYNTIIYTDQYQKRVELGANWGGRVPLIPFRSNSGEIPLINRVKTQQDAINMLMSVHQDNLQEDMRSTILVIKNYEGEDLEEFRSSLAATGAVKVSTVDGVSGGVEPLKIEIDSKNYEVGLKELKRSFFLNARMFDPTDELMSSRPNEVNLKSVYTIINLDCNDLEGEFRASFEHLLWFVNKYLKFTHNEDYSGQKVKIKFNRDEVIDETARIEQFVMSAGKIPDVVLLTHHPWIDDPEEALDAMKKQAAEAKIDALSGLGHNGSVEGRFNMAGGLKNDKKTD